jgi:hypothetical protein
MARPDAGKMATLKRAIIMWRRQGSDWHVSGQDMIEFTAFLGHPYTEQRFFIVPIDDPEVWRKIELIAGPHGYTFVKMIEARNGETKTEEVKAD